MFVIILYKAPNNITLFALFSSTENTEKGKKLKDKRLKIKDESFKD